MLDYLAGVANGKGAAYTVSSAGYRSAGVFHAELSISTRPL
jgi:hypothetical protein